MVPTLGAMGGFLAAGLFLAFASAASSAEGDTVGPWRKGDMAYSTTLADDRPNEESERLKAKHFTALVPERVFKGEKGELSFRVVPRCADWAGILVLDKEGKPVPLAARRQVAFTDPEGNAVPGKAWDQKDQKVLYSDASPIILPKTCIVVSQKSGEIDRVTVDFAQWKLEDSRVQMSAFLDGPTSKHGAVTAKDGRFWRDGKPMYFWGGHENHVPPKAMSDLYAETYRDAGINIQRSIAFEEMVADPATGELNTEQLDKYHYLVAKLGEKGIYFMMTGAPIGCAYGFEKGKGPADWASHYHFWVSPEFRQAWKNALRNGLTAPNPYNGGKALKDDPSLICIELSNETGMNERRFDFNRLDMPEGTRLWREEFNRFLAKKYGGREALAKAWETHSLLPHEDPAKNTILIPGNFRGARAPYGGTGQHDQYVTGRWYRNGLPPEKNPRVVDAVEFNKTVARKPCPFDFNNATTPEETERLRVAFNEFLEKKYGDRAGLEKAWEEDPLFPWETPEEKLTNPKAKVPAPPKPGRTILIPTNFRGEDAYGHDPASRLADPRVSDAIEFTCAVQKAWATDMANFLRNEVGVKCGIGWNGDTFHVVQVPNHKANADSPLDVAIAAAYLDSDNGDQLTSRTKNLKRFTAYGRIHGRPMFSYEWSMWTNQGPFVYEYGLLAGLMGRVYGFDGYAHHKMSACKYPISDPMYSLKVHFITPLTDRPRRGAFSVSQWVLQRSRIEEEGGRILVGFPDNDAFIGGPERRMSNWAFENWIMHQLGIEGYSFQEAYDGPADRIVIHDGRGPYGDYRKAKHAILWCHSNSDREGRDPEAKKKWFALHGIEFKPGEKYFLNDRFFATTEDMTEYNVVRRKAEEARWKLIADNQKAAPPVKIAGGHRVWTADGSYWAAEPDPQPTELDRRIYQALKKWGYPLPFEENEIDLVWRSRDRTMEMDTRKECFVADRDDMQVWFGRGGEGKTVALSRLEAKTDEKQYAVALLPWDTADFKTAKTLAVWTMWNGQVTVKLPMPEKPEVFAVNWLGKRIYRVSPIAASKESVTFATIRDDDVFCYEIER